MEKKGKEKMVVFKLVVAMRRKWIFKSEEKKEAKC